MAVYAALVSLMHVLDRIQYPTCPVSLEKLPIQSLFNKVSFLVDFLEDYYQGISHDLERKITAAAYAAEDIIELYVVDKISGRYDGSRDAQSCLDLEKVIQEIDLIVQESMKIIEKNGEKDQLPRRYVGVGSSAPPSGTSKMVGLDTELIRLMDQLTTDTSSRQIISIVGMGGIGKTTLARNIYKHPYVVYHFHIRAWVVISQDYNIREIILCLLCEIGVERRLKPINKNTPKETLDLGEQLHKGLCGKKYLIILDDIWSSVLWDEIKRFFPDNNNGSRIMLTTRLLSVAHTVGSCSLYEMNFLDDEKSWELLCEMIFGQKACPHELEKLGKIIAKSCKGLPLMIVVIGGLLKLSRKKQDYWGYVAKNVSSIISTRKDGDCLKILSLSYNHLPLHLKPCFLYMATFREDRKIDVSNLIKLWVADGLLKPSKDRVLEEVALEYVNDLIGRNLVMVGERDLSGKIESCIVHGLLREFCSTEAQNEKFLCLIEKDTLKLPQRFESERRLVCHSFLYPNVPSLSSARSFICSFLSGKTFPYGGRLLRVFHCDGHKESDIDIAQLINLRYLAINIAWRELPRLLSSLSLLSNLETLVILGEVLENYILPSEIWELPNIRHLIFVRARVALLDPTGAQVSYVRNNLQTLHCIRNFNCTDEVVNIIPNLKELSISYVRDNFLEVQKLSRCFTNLARLRKLEKLSISFNIFNFYVKCFLHKPDNLTFSPNLRVLSLSMSNIPWENMAIIGSLPNLEVLLLQSHAFCGEEWSSTEGEFQRLKCLSICQCHLRIWRAESSHFPRLERLIFKGLELEEFPLGIAEVALLKLIELETFVISAVISVKEILEERQNQGHDDLLIKVRYYCKSVEEEMELKKLVNDNFQVEILFGAAVPAHMEKPGSATG